MQSANKFDNEVARLRLLVAQKDEENKKLREENTFLKSEFNYFIQLIQEAEGILYGYKPPRPLKYDPQIQYTSLSTKPEYNYWFQPLKAMSSYHSF